MVIQATLTTGLAQNRFFDDAAFVKYLAYLQYWKRPEYARFIMWVLRPDEPVNFIFTHILRLLSLTH